MTFDAYRLGRASISAALSIGGQRFLVQYQCEEFNFWRWPCITHYQGKKMMTATKPAITSTQVPHSTADLLPVGGNKPSQVP